MVLVASRGRQLCTTSVVLVASRGRRWCWWLARVVGCSTTSVVLVASRGCRLWYDVGGVGG